MANCLRLNANRQLEAIMFFRFIAGLIAALSFAGSAFTMMADGSLPDCLYAISTLDGDKKVERVPCGNDMRRIGEDRHVRAAMGAFGIPLDMVVFQGCPGGRFYVTPDGSNSNRFLVRYPSEVQSNYLAPIVHELGHVVQMLEAGGLDALDSKNNSRRIELGADFLTGLVYNIALSDLDRGDFQTNLNLAGSYKVQTDDHGIPEHREAAFLRGVVRKYPYPQLTISQALAHWYANDYPMLPRQVR